MELLLTLSTHVRVNLNLACQKECAGYSTRSKKGLREMVSIRAMIAT